MSDFTKWRCMECRESSMGFQLLTAQNPFDADDTISGCPHCKSVACFERLCDEAGCLNEGSCGSPFGQAGYKTHCHLHPPKETSK